MENLENMDIDDIQNEMKKFRFNKQQLDYFREQEFDGIVISNLDYIPEFPAKTVGSLVKFKAFMKKMTGKEFSDKENKFLANQFDKEAIDKNNNVIGKNEETEKDNYDKPNSPSLVLGSNLTHHVKEVTKNDSSLDSESFTDNAAFGVNQANLSNDRKMIQLMPIFSKNLEKDLKKDKITKTNFIDMVKEIVKYYKQLNVRLDTKTHYKEISEFIIRKYPSVVRVLEKERLLMSDCSSSDKIESQLVSILSQRISKKNRNSRYLNKSNSVTNQQSVSREADTEPITSILIKDENTIDPSDYEGWHVHLKRIYGDQSCLIKMNQVLHDTFGVRRERIINSSFTFDDKITEYNYLNDEDNLINEFDRILGNSNFERNLERVFDIFEGELIFKDFPNKNNEQLLNILVEVEMKINSKSRKNEWKPICLVYEKNEPIDFVNNLVLSPRLFVIKNGFKIERYLIVYFNNTLMEIPKEKSFYRILKILFSYYFVFDIEYDCKVENFLIFLDKILVQSKRKEHNKKTLTYLKYLSLVKDKFDEM